MTHLPLCGRRARFRLLLAPAQTTRHPSGSWSRVISQELALASSLRARSPTGRSDRELLADACSCVSCAVRSGGCCAPWQASGEELGEAAHVRIQGSHRVYRVGSRGGTVASRLRHWLPMRKLTPCPYILPNAASQRTPPKEKRHGCNWRT